MIRSESAGFLDTKKDAQFLSMRLNIEYTRSIEDTERVRRACVRYLQNWSSHFYPERLDIVKQLEQLAADLGGQLEVPQLSWKYVWIQKIFGWTVAKQAQVYYNQCKSSLIRSWDRALVSLGF